MPGPNGDLAGHILDALAADGLSPTALVGELRALANEDSVRDAMWLLIDKGDVEVTRDGLLRRTS
jgi:hypothetical protein